MTLKQISDMIGQKFKRFIADVHCDIGVVVLSRNKGLAMMVGGKNGDMGEDVVPFLKEAVQRIQQVIDEAEGGNESIVNPGSGGFIHQKATGKFVTLEEAEEEHRGEKGFSA